MFETDTAFDRPGRLKIFISYSRKDALEFADQLFLALVACGHAPKIDRNETMPGEDWRARLTRLILEAETVVFVLTDKAVVSEEIAWEIREAERLAKRIIPILPNALTAAVPAELSKRQFIHFYPEATVPSSGFGYGLSKLDQAVKRDEGWIRNYVILQQRAAQWSVQGQRKDDLVQGTVLAEAEALVLKKPVELPPIEPRVQSFLIACRAADLESQAEKRQQIADRELAVKAVEDSQRERQNWRWRRDVLGSLVGVATVVAAYFYYRSKEIAWQADLRSKAQYLTARANDLVSVGDPGTALLLMIEALSSKPKSDTDSSWKLSETIARKANKAYTDLGGYNKDALFNKHTGPVRSVAFHPLDPSRLLSTSEDGTGWLWVWSEKSAGRIQLQHVAPMTAGRFSSDGSIVATADTSGTVSLWDSRDGKRVGNDIKMGASVTVLEFHGSGDSATLLVATSDGKAIVSDITGASIYRLDGHNGAITHGRFNRDGTRIVTASRDLTAKVWRLNGQSGVSVTTLSGHTQLLNSAEFHPEHDRFVVTASDDRTAIIWRKAEGDQDAYTEYLQLTEHDGAVNGATFTLDGSNVLTWTLDGFIRQWPLDGLGKPRIKFLGHSDAINVLVPCQHLKGFVTGSLDGTARVWELGHNSSTQVFRAHRKSVTSIALDGQCKHAASASEDGTVRVWQLDPIREIRTTDNAPLHGVSWRPGTTQLASAGGSLRKGSTNHFVRFWDEPTRTEVAPPAEFKAAVNSVMFSPDGKRAVAASDDGTATLLDLGPSRSPRQLVQNGGFVRQAAFSADGAKVVTASRDGYVRIFDTGSGTELSRRKSASWANTVAYHPDNTSIAIGYRDGGIVIWDGNRDIATLDQKFVLSVAFSASGKALASAGSDGLIRLWDSSKVSTPVKLRDLQARSRVWSVAFGEDDKLVSGSQDGIVRVWDVTTGDLIDLFPGNQSPIRAVSVNPTRTIAAAAAEDGTIRFHDISKYTPFDAENVKKQIGRCLTEEQRRYFNLQLTTPEWCKDKWPNKKGPDLSGPLKQ